MALLAASLLCLWRAVVLHRLRPWIAGALVFFSFGMLGAGWAGLREARTRASPLAALAGRHVSIWGAMGSDPQPGTRGWTASLNPEVVFPSLRGWPSAIRVMEPLWVQGEGRVPRTSRGDSVVADGVLEANRGAFGTYLRHRGYGATMRIQRIWVRGPPGDLLARVANAVRSAIQRATGAIFPAREAGLLLGLALGDRSLLDPEVSEDFRATGLSHLLAVSGGNVAMFLGPVLGLTASLGLGRRGRLVVGVVAVAFFTVLTRAEPSVQRAAVMSGLVLVGVFLGRPRSPPAILGGAVLGLLAFNPTLVYAIGFQLSVAATAGLVLLASPLGQRLGFLPRPLALAASTTIAAQAGVTPMILYHFGAVPTVTLAANLLAFPAVAPSMLLGLLAGTVAVPLPALGRAIAPLARVPLVYLEWVADRLARAPLPYITSTEGRLSDLVRGLAVLALAGWWIRSGRKFSRRVAIAAAAGLCLFVWATGVKAGPPRVFTVVFFHVGQGDSALIRSPGGASILIDGGPDPDLVATKVAALGVHRLDVLIASHAHADHVAGLPAVLARIPVGLVADPGCEGDSPSYAEFLGAVAAARVPFQHPRAGSTLRIGDVRIDVLAPERCFTIGGSEPNNDSLILRVSNGDDSVLFPGDAEGPEQSEALRSFPGLLPATVLKVPHHGGDTSLDAFLPAVGARAAIVSVGPNRYGHPDPSVLGELRQAGTTVLRTDQIGDATVVFGDDGLLIESGHG